MNTDTVRFESFFIVFTKNKILFFLLPLVLVLIQCEHRTNILRIQSKDRIRAVKINFLSKMGTLEILRIVQHVFIHRVMQPDILSAELIHYLLH